MADKRNNIIRDQKPGSRKLVHSSVTSVTPSFYQQEYPKLVAFLEKYFEYIQDTDGFGDFIAKLQDVRNVDITESEYAEILFDNEFGSAFPELASIDETVAIRLFEYWYKSKGTREAVEAYFRIFLNTNVEVTYPKDEMLIVDGGNWDEDLGDYSDNDSKLDETTARIQDDWFYQAYSYLVTAGQSISDWGNTFEKAAHPAGFNVFGKVELSGTTAAFNNIATRSPTIVPGFQDLDAEILLLGSAAHAMGVAPQVITKTFINLLGKALVDEHSFTDVNRNWYTSTYAIYDLHETAIGDLETSNATQLRRPARIDISVSPPPPPPALGSELLTNGPGGFSGTTNWVTGSGETETEVSGRLRVTVDSTGSVYVSQAVTLDTGKTYRLQGSFSRGTLDDNIFLRVAGSSILSLSSVQTLDTFVDPNDGSFSADFTPGVTSMHVGFRVNSGPSIGEYFEIIDISLKEVL
jgi:hypothetical protein